jgi:hypothetical protein
MKKLLVLFVALVMAFAALPAFAQDKADWSFYGQVRMWTAWESVKAETPAILSGTGGVPFLGQYGYQGYANAQRWKKADGNWEGDSGLAWELQGNSRIGANVKWGDIGGRFEYGSTLTSGCSTAPGTSARGLCFSAKITPPGSILSATCADPAAVSVMESGLVPFMAAGHLRSN